jgi:hypothetical protein
MTMDEEEDVKISQPSFILIRQLDLFERVPISHQVRSEHFLQIQPITVLDNEHGKSGSTISWRYFGDHHFLNLGASYIYFQVKLLENGSTVSAESTIAPINLFAYTMIKNLKFSMNSVTISLPYQTHSYCEYIKHLMSFNNESKSQKMIIKGWSKDKANAINDLIEYNSTDKKLTCANDGLLQRRAYFKSGKAEFLFPLSFDFTKSGKYLLNHLNFELEIQLQSSEFGLMFTGSTKADYQVTTAILYLCKQEVYETTELTIDNLLNDFNVIYEYNDNVCRMLTLTSGVRTFSFDPLIHGRTPTRLLIGLVEATSAAGTSYKNPFAFKPHNIQSISVFIGNKSYPYIEEQYNFDSNECIIPYNRLLTHLNCGLDTNSNISLSLADYKEAFTFFSFAFADQASIEDNLRQAPSYGALRIDMKFHDNLTTTLNAILLLTYPSKVEITKARTVHYTSPNE